MADERQSVEKHIIQLSEELAKLTTRVDQISDALNLLQVSRASMTTRSLDEQVNLAQTTVPTVEGARAGVDARAVPIEESSWEGESSKLLSRASTVSFLVVVAIALRVVTDNSILPQDIGSFVGLGYSALLLVGGWFMYARNGAQAPVFTACGALLAFAIIAETNLNPKFHLLPLFPAFALLIVTGGVTAAITNLFRVRLPFSVGTIGMALAAVAVTFHEKAPDFRYLIATLLIANLLGKKSLLPG